MVTKDSGRNFKKYILAPLVEIGAVPNVTDRRQSNAVGPAHNLVDLLPGLASEEDCFVNLRFANFGK